MRLASSSAGVKIAGVEVKRSCHACAFFHTKEEYYQVLLPFMKEGFETGDKTLHIVDSCDHQDHLERLNCNQISTEKLLASGQFELEGWGNTYLKPGHFSQNAMLEMVEKFLLKTKADGYGMSRLVGKMEWACHHEIPGVKDVVKYEAQLNNFISKYDTVLVCTYDISKHSASVVLDILRTHPYVLIGGTMHENPYYVTPEELLAEIELREHVAT